MIPMTHDRAHVRMLQNAHAGYIESQYRSMEQLPGNPQNVIIRTIGPATRTFIARGNRLENRAIFTGEEADEQIAEVLRHFVDHGANCVIEVNPANFYVNPPATWEKRLLKRLLELGCAIHDFRCVWCRFSPLPPGEGRVRAITERREHRDEDGGATHAQGNRPHPNPPPEGEGTKLIHRCERFEADHVGQYIALAKQIDAKVEWTEDRIAAMSGPGWRHYILFDEQDVPASNGSLFIHGPSAYLAWWYTQPSHRGRGMQQEGITHRLRDAFAQGCKHVFTVTDFNFSSPNNLQRCGLTLAYNYLLLRRDPLPLSSH
jgi:hypothetical protein